MTATVKQLAEKLEISQQTVRRYVKDVMKIKAEPRKTLVLTDEQAAQVAHYFTTENPIAKAREVKEQAAQDETIRLYQEITKLKDELHAKELEAVGLAAQIDGKDRTIEFLEGEVAKLHKIIEREQANNMTWLDKWKRKRLKASEEE